MSSIRIIILSTIFIILNNLNCAQDNNIKDIGYIEQIATSDLEKITQDTECGICLNKFQDFNLCYKARCQSSASIPHIYHMNCILQWLKTGSRRCPICSCPMDNPDKDLIIAIKAGNLNTVEALINKGANVNVKNKHGESALALAILKGHPNIAQLLIEKGADTLFINSNNVPILTYAAYKGYLSIAQLAIDKGANVNTQDNLGGVAIISAAFKGHYSIVQLLINNRADVNIQDNNQISALKAAKKNNHKEIIRLLMNKGAVDL